MPETKVCTVDIVIKTLITEVGLSDVTPDMEKLSWEELGIDSLGFTELAAGLEDTLALPIPDDRVKHTKNIAELVSLINSLLVTETV